VFVNADIRAIWMHTDASKAATPLVTLHTDPLMAGLRVGMKF
jgi:outer membrane protein